MGAAQYKSREELVYESLKRDILDVLSNYFQLVGGVEVKIESTNIGYNIFITAEGEAFKGFKLVSN